jgi:hypothetical protein
MVVLSLFLTTHQCSPEDMHANIIFSNAAYHQLGCSTKTSEAVAHVFNETFRVSKLLTKIANAMMLANAIMLLIFFVFFFKSVGLCPNESLDDSTHPKT